MNNINDSKPSKKVFFLTLLAILFVGIPLTVLALQKQQFIKDFAWSTTQSAAPKCTTDTGNASIVVTFTNTESSKDMDVIAQDLQTGNVVNLGTVKANKTATDTIVTQEKSLKAGSVLFTMKWTDGSSGTDTRTAEYKVLNACAPPPPYCPANPINNTGYCEWDPLPGATSYAVTVNDSTTGDLIASDTVSSAASQSAFPFPMLQGKSYTCSVKPISECRQGRVAKSDPKICTPTAPVCPVPPQKLGECSWSPVEGATGYNVTVKETGSGTTVKSQTIKSPDTSLSYTADPNKTYQCTVTALNICSQSVPVDSEPFSCNVPTLTPPPTPSVSPSVGPSPSTSPSDTPVPSTTPRPSPTATPTPTPTPTPTVTPTPTPTVTPTPNPTATPYPTLTPYVIVRTIVNNQVVPGSQQTVVVTQTQTQQTVAQPTTFTQPQTTQVAQPTAAPKVKPTGNISNALILVGTSTVLLFVGGILFFLL